MQDVATVRAQVAQWIGACWYWGLMTEGAEWYGIGSRALEPLTCQIYMYLLPANHTVGARVIFTSGTTAPDPLDFARR